MGGAFHRARRGSMSIRGRSATVIAAHACRKHSGRVGRSAGAKSFAEAAIALAVRAHLRHVHTGYDRLLMEGWERDEARAEIAGALQEAEARWRVAG